MVEIVQYNQQCVVIATDSLTIAQLTGERTFGGSRHAFKSNSLAIIDFPELHSQKRGNPQSCCKQSALAASDESRYTATEGNRKMKPVNPSNGGCHVHLSWRWLGCDGSRHRFTS
jgi:hypothetical protein